MAHHLKLLGVLFLLIVSAFYYTSYQIRVKEQQSVEVATNELLLECPRSKQKYDEITQILGVKLTISDIEFSDKSLLGSTSFYQDVYGRWTIQIFIDAKKIQTHGDMLEPVLAHEIYHAWDALIVSPSIGNFVKAREQQKNLPYLEQPAEIAAIKEEDFVREFLIQHYSDEYKDMPRTHHEADIKAKAMGIF